MSLVDEYRKLDTQRGSAPQQRPTTRRQVPVKETRGNYVRYGNGSHLEAALYGAADTITFGYLDEAGAWVDSKIYGVSYEEQLRENRRFLKHLNDEYTGTFIAGQVVGGFVPFLGWGGRVAGAVRSGRLISGTGGMVAAGAVQGGLYGMGSAESDRLFDYERLRGAAVGAAWGAGGGLVLGSVILPGLRTAGNRIGALVRRGRTPRIEASFTPSPRTAAPAANAVDELATPSVARTAAQQADALADDAAAQPKRWNDLNGVDEDVVPEGAILSTKELLGPVEAARQAVAKRLSRLTPQQAQEWAKRIEKAEAEGTLVNDPHYRSLLGIDIDDPNIDQDDIRRAATNLEEATDAIMEAAGYGTKTAKTMREEFIRRYGDAASPEDMKAALARHADLEKDARLANHQSMVGALQFLRAKDKYLTRVLDGDEEAREAMARELSKAIETFAYARAMKSKLGRSLGVLGQRDKLAWADTTEEVIETESVESIKARVSAAMKELGNTELASLLARMRTLDDVAEVEAVLLNADNAKQLTLWNRAMNSVSAYIKSNSLTPATGLFNTVGFVIHDLFRNRAARAWAARNYELAGRADEAMKLRFMNEVERSVYWTAWKRGMAAFADRIKWEFWDDVYRITGIFNPTGRAALRASAAQRAMIAGGFRPAAQREQAELGRLAFDPSRFNARAEQRLAERGGGAFARLVYQMERAGATVANTVDAMGMAIGRITVGALDDMGQEFIRLKEGYALAARQAISEAMDLGLPEDQLAKYASRRAQELAERPSVDILEQIEERIARGQDLTAEERFLASRDYAIEKEAQRTLFLDAPTSAPGQAFMKGAKWLDRAVGLGQVEGILMTYVKTPTRIFERGLVHYTPWGAKAKEVQAILAKGGMEAELEKARMEIGTMLIGLGAAAGFSGAIVLTNGGYDNSANLVAPPNRIQIGDSFVELNRLDPFAMTLALGGFLGQALRTYEDNKTFGTEEAFKAATDIAYLAVRDAIFEKTYMTSFRDLLKATTSEGGEGGAAAAAKIYANAMMRAIPTSGFSRTINDTLRQNAPEAVSVMDQLFRAVPGLGYGLPDRIDAVGNPVEGRDLGITFGRTDDVDEVTRQLAELQINISNLEKRDPAGEGFRLTAQELSDLRTIRGNEATNEWGMTMKEALADLFADPWFQGLRSKEAKRQAVMDVMSSYNEKARVIYEERNPRYQSEREAHRAFFDYLKDGMSTDEARREANALVEEMGLEPSERL